MKKKRALLKAGFWGYIIFFMVFAHEEIGNEIRMALKLWAGVLIPSLFPYLVLAQYVTTSGVMEIFSLLKKWAHKIFNISESGANVYLCSFISGYPSGAMCVSRLYKDRIIEKNEAERLVCFTNNTGPLFVISVVGSNMLGSTGDGLALYVIQNISAMAIGIWLGKSTLKVPYNTRRYIDKEISLDSCSQNAINTMLMIGAFLVLASVVAEIFLISFKILPWQGKFFYTYARVIIYSILEISNGVKVLSDFGNSRIIFSLISGLLSWSGLCVIMQIKSVLPDEFSMKNVVLCKLWQSLLSFVLAFLYKCFFTMKISLETEKIFMLSSVGSVIIFLLFLIKKRHHSIKNDEYL